MNIGVVGNRIGWDRDYVWRRMSEYLKPGNVIVTGGAQGVDTYAEEFSRVHGFSIIVHRPNMLESSPERYYSRNAKIVNDSDIIIAFDKKEGRSGTKNTISLARKAGKKVILIKG